MSHLQIHERGEQVIHTAEGFQVAALSAGMESGRPSVALRIDLPDGKVIIAETSMRATAGRCNGER